MLSRVWLRSGLVGIAALALLLSTAVVSSAASTKSAKGKPIIIGAVIDETGTMAPFDVPAMEAAEIQANTINKNGGVGGRPLEFKVYNDLLTPSLTRSDAQKAVAAGADIMWVTCDVTYATPAIEVGLHAHLLTVAPCTGNNEMGPSRFGAPGKLAFSFGNAPQSDGAVLARLLIQKGWKTATVVTDKLLTYFTAVCKNFTADFQKDGGKIVTQLSYTTGNHTVTQVGQKAADSGAAATLLCTTTTPTLPAFVTSVRSLGNTKPIVGPWAITGGTWEPKSTTISNNIWWSTYASIFGRGDPSTAIRTMYKEMVSKGDTPVTGGFVTGPSAVQGIVAAIKGAKGSLVGLKLAAQMQSFNKLSTMSGPVSFSAKWHAVIGRPYRIIEVAKGKPHFVEMLSPGKLASGA